MSKDRGSQAGGWDGDEAPTHQLLVVSIPQASRESLQNPGPASPLDKPLMLASGLGKPVARFQLFTPVSSQSWSPQSSHPNSRMQSSGW